MVLFVPAANLLLEHRVGNQELQLTDNVIFITERNSEVVVSCFGSGTLGWVGPSGAPLSTSSADTVYQERDGIMDAQRLIIRAFTLDVSGNYTCKSSALNLEKNILITMGKWESEGWRFGFTDCCHHSPRALYADEVNSVIHAKSFLACVFKGCTYAHVSAVLLQYCA